MLVLPRSPCIAMHGSLAWQPCSLQPSVCLAALLCTGCSWEMIGRAGYRTGARVMGWRRLAAGAGSLDSLGLSSSEYLPDASDCQVRIAALYVQMLFACVVVCVQVACNPQHTRTGSKCLFLLDGHLRTVNPRRLTWPSA